MQLNATSLYWPYIASPEVYTPCIEFPWNMCLLQGIGALIMWESGIFENRAKMTLQEVQLEIGLGRKEIAVNAIQTSS